MISCSRCGVALTSRLRTTMKWWSSSRLSPVYPVSKSFHTSKAFRERIKQEQQPETRLSIKKMFANEDKAKETFMEAIEYFTRQDVTHRRGHVEFIYAALKEMEPYGLNRDLEAYKKILDVFPKGKFIPENLFQAEFLHYPKQQFCAVDLLEQMEENGVIPDDEMGEMLKNIFGRNAVPRRKYMRMLYWMPKFKHLSPWPLPDPVPDDAYELARLGMLRLGTVDIQSELHCFQAKDVEESIDDTWIIGVQSPTQQELMNRVPDSGPIFVEGPFLLWMRKKSLAYFILRADAFPRPPPVDEDDISNVSVAFKREKDLLPVKALTPSVHEQADGVILAACATGTSSRDSLLSWIRLLQRTNPRLGEVPVVFKSRSPVGAVIAMDDPEGRKRLEDGKEGEEEDDRPRINAVNFNPAFTPSS